jgi:hypothetical protein
MEKKPIIKNSKIHGLVIFKGPPIKDKSNETTTSFESVDQENKIILNHELAPFAASYRYSIVLINESAAPITEVKIKVKYPKFLLLSRITPPIISLDIPTQQEKDVSQINFEIDKLSEITQKVFNFYLMPLTTGDKGQIITNLTYVNNKDYVRVLNSDPLEIEIKTVSIKPKSIPSSKIQGFSKITDIKKASKSLGIASKEKPNSIIYFSFIEQILAMNKFQLIAKDDNKNIAWFFGTDSKSKEDILIIGQIVSNKVELLGASKNHESLISTLTTLSTQFKNRLLSMNLVDSIDNIYTLECKHCGGILQKFPDKGETIECQNCHKEQIVW